MRASTKPPFGRDQPIVMMYGTLVFVLIVVALQVWLLTATLDAWLGGDDSVLWPAAAASAAGFLLNAGLLAFLDRIEGERPTGDWS